MVRSKAAIGQPCQDFNGRGPLLIVSPKVGWLAQILISLVKSPYSIFFDGSITNLIPEIVFIGWETAF